MTYVCTYDKYVKQYHNEIFIDKWTEISDVQAFSLNKLIYLTVVYEIIINNWAVIIICQSNYSEIASFSSYSL